MTPDRPWAQTPQYAAWIVESAPCWRCGSRKGVECATKEGLNTRPHEPRSRLASAVRDKKAFNGGHRIISPEFWGENRSAWEDTVHPHVFTVKARVEHPDTLTPDRPIRPGETYYKWKPDSNRLVKSRTRPVIGDDGILFWPEVAHPEALYSSLETATLNISQKVQT